MTSGKRHLLKSEGAVAFKWSSEKVGSLISCDDCGDGGRPRTSLLLCPRVRASLGCICTKTLLP